MSLMITLFCIYLSKFMYVIMDNILIYSKMIEEHKEHLKQMFGVLRSNKLYV